MPQPFTGRFRPALADEAVTRVVTAARADTINYVLVVRTAEGRRHRFRVDHDLYEAAEPGTRVTGETWHGRLVRVRLGPHSDGEWSYTRLQAALVILWSGLILIVGLGPPLADIPLHIVLFTWWIGVMASVVAVGWPSWMWTAPAAIGGTILVYRLIATLRLARHRARFPPPDKTT